MARRSPYGVSRGSSTERAPGIGRSAIGGIRIVNVNLQEGLERNRHILALRFARAVRRCCPVASGWFKDPYGRHEARWMSAGTPTSLVRNGDVEQTDPPPSGGAAFVPTERTDSRVGSPAPRSGMRRWAIALLGLGVLGIAAGFLLLFSAQSASSTAQRFTPTPAEIAAVHVGAASPSDCCRL